MRDTYYVAGIPFSGNELYHYRTKGSRNGVRRFQNEDGSLTAEGRRHYGIGAALNDLGKGISNTVSNATKPVSDWYTGKEAGSRFAEATRNQLANRYNPAEYNRYGQEAQNAMRDYYNAPRQRIDQTRKDISRNTQNAINSVSRNTQNAVSNVRNFVNDKASDISNWYTGNDARDRYVDETRKRVANRYNPNEENRHGQEAEKALNEYNNAPQQRLNRIPGQVRNAVNNTTKAVSDKVSDARNFVNDKASDISNWYTGNDARDRYVDETRKRVANRYNPNEENRHGQEAEKALKEYNNAPQQRVDQARKNVERAANAVKNFAQDSAEDISDAANKVGDFARDKAEDVSDAAKKAGTKIKEAANEAGDRISDAASNASAAVSKAASNVADWGGDQLKKGKGFLKGLFGR